MGVCLHIISNALSPVGLVSLSLKMIAFHKTMTCSILPSLYIWGLHVYSVIYCVYFPCCVHVVLLAAFIRSKLRMIIVQKVAINSQSILRCLVMVSDQIVCAMRCRSRLGVCGVPCCHRSHARLTSLGCAFFCLPLHCWRRQSGLLLLLLFISVISSYVCVKYGMEHTWKNISSVLGVSEYQHILGVHSRCPRCSRAYNT